MAPKAWRGALLLPYHVGPGPARVHLKVAFNWDIKPVHDVVARIPGVERPDEWVVRGNYYDAWVNGAEDPISGMVPLWSTRGSRALLKQGWQPARTIFAAGGTARSPCCSARPSGSRPTDELREKAVAYVNTDGNGCGYWDMASSRPPRAPDQRRRARRAGPGGQGLGVGERAQEKALADAASAEQREGDPQAADLRLDALGSAVTTPPSSTTWRRQPRIGFGGEDNYAIYHSIYDDFDWVPRFSDTDFAYGRALAQTAGLAVLRLADAGLLPFEFAALADATQEYLKDLKKLLEQKQEEIAERNRQIDDGIFQATNDPRRPKVAPPREDVPPHLNFAPLENAVAALQRSADRYAKARAAAEARAAAPDVARVNAILIRSERALLSPDGSLSTCLFGERLVIVGESNTQRCSLPAGELQCGR